MSYRQRNMDRQIDMVEGERQKEREIKGMGEKEKEQERVETQRQIKNTYIQKENDRDTQFNRDLDHSVFVSLSEVLLLF